MGDTRTLADRLEDTIRTAVDREVDDAVTAAGRHAFESYRLALRSMCGVPFDVIVADALVDAEKRIAQAAKAHALQSRTTEMIRRLTAANANP